MTLGKVKFFHDIKLLQSSSIHIIFTLYNMANKTILGVIIIASSPLPLPLLGHNRAYSVTTAMYFSLTVFQ